MSTAGNQEPLKVALVGAGVVGLTCTLALLQKGISVQLFEAAVCVNRYCDIPQLTYIYL